MQRGFGSLQVPRGDGLVPSAEDGGEVVGSPGAVGLAPVVNENAYSKRTDATTEGEEGKEVHVEAESVLGHFVDVAALRGFFGLVGPTRG